MPTARTKTCQFHTENVFTRDRFSGNPLAIVLAADHLSDTQMQVLAREFNLPETIFVQRPDDKKNTAKVRIFTPEYELPFAGHPTIGCAIFLNRQQHTGEDNNKQILLEEVAGLVAVDVVCRAGETNAELTAPVIPVPSANKAADNKHELTIDSAAKALGLHTEDIASAPNAHAGGPTFLFVPLRTRAALSRAKPVQPLCNELTNAYGATGIYPYYLTTEHSKIDARMFAEAAGIPEDPATGSAAALLASQLNADGYLQEGENAFEIHQGEYMNRPSTMHLRVELANAQIESVKVSGSSVAISHGEISIPEQA